MTGSAHRTATQWLLLCVLLFGVVGMHHVAMGEGMSSAHATMSTGAHQAPEEPAPQPAHDMFHLCVAVLCAVASLLLLSWLLLRTGGLALGFAGSKAAWPRAPDHPPPRGGRALLSSLCVLRL